MEHSVDILKQFVELTPFNVGFLLLLGFLGGLVSGFIGSGGAFVITPGLMNLGASSSVAVASNMCHKFPKAMVGAFKRHKYGQVDLKLGAILGISASAGVQLGIQIQKMILHRWGSAGADLYVSVVFVIILSVVGIFMLFDLLRSNKQKSTGETSSFAKRMQRISLPPMIKLKNSDASISVWVTVPVGFATGLLAATIAVGGFVGVPGMIYIIGVLPLTASATELVIAFIMGLTGVITWGLDGFVDIRVVLLILVGSLFGVQIGAIGTTYVRDYVIKFMMVAIMLIVAVSRLVALPTYLDKLGTISISNSTYTILKDVSFAILCVALAVGGIIALGSMLLAKRAESKSQREDSTVSTVAASYKPEEIG